MTTNDLRIITHAYAERLPLYARLLRFHLLGGHFSGRTPLRVKVRVDVVYWPGDAAVVREIEFAETKMRQNVRLVRWPMDKPRLFRRAIARHEACTNPHANVLWFADCDYVAGAGALEAMASLGPDAELSYPKFVWRNESHQAGQDEIDKLDKHPWPVLGEGRYVQCRERRAIGGIQLIGANVAGRIGYLGGTQWTREVNPDDGFSDFRDDCAWRRENHLGYGTPVDVPNVFRLRHIESGFDERRKRESPV